MPFQFRIWDQAHDEHTMGIRVADVDELTRLADLIHREDLAGNWENLQEYLETARDAVTPPVPFVRSIDVLWLNARLLIPSPYTQDRKFRVTYTGNLRAQGGFASQGYCIVAPDWWDELRQFHQEPIDVQYFAGDARDLIVVMP